MHFCHVLLPAGLESPQELRFGAVPLVDRQPLEVHAVGPRPVVQLQGDLALGTIPDLLGDARRRVVDEGFQPYTTWESWLREVIRSRAIDRLRVLERQVFLSWQGRTSDVSGDSPSPEPRSPHPSPSREVAERERRQRQGLLLSDVLAEFCRWCEKKSPTSGEPKRLKLKEAYERSLHGQSPAEIAAAMGVSPDAVYQWLHQAREWVRQRIAQKDIDRSVFLTLYGGMHDR